MKREIILRCDCGSDHFISVTIWGEEIGDAHLSLEGCHCYVGFRERVKRAWWALRGWDSHKPSGLLERGQTEELIGFLTANLDNLYKRPQ